MASDGVPAVLAVEVARSGGRPKVPVEIRRLIREMSLANRLWLYRASTASYVRLMEAKEESVHARIIALRNDIIEPLVEANNGQIVKNTGDGFFATFETVREGFQCAVVLQEKVAAKEHGYEPGERIAFRMCINLCEAIFEKGDVFGDGVNIAARLQHFAPPGGIVLSAAAREQLGANVGQPVHDLGELRLKNLARPVIGDFDHHLRPRPVQHPRQLERRAEPTVTRRLGQRHARHLHGRWVDPRR
jgi:class 3 adenylate cyclase